MSSVLASGVFLLLGLISAKEPNYPPDAYKGGTVVALVRFMNGSIDNIEVLWGEEPFLSSSTTALNQWRFDRGESGRIMVVVHFRQPDLYFLNTREQTIPLRERPVSFPYPILILQPDYPALATGAGSVILRAEISQRGSVSDVRVIKSLGILTETSLDALKHWEFLPARNSSGENVASFAYIVMVYRVPITTPQKK